MCVYTQRMSVRKGCVAIVHAWAEVGEHTHTMINEWVA